MAAGSSWTTKATAKADEITAQNIYPGYKRQLEMYQFLIEKAGFNADARIWLVYANGIKDVGAFNDVLMSGRSPSPTP